MPTNLYKYRKQRVRARSRDMRCGIGYQRYDALWRFASIPKHKRRSERAKQLLSWTKVLMQTDPGPYFQSPVGNRYEVEAEQEFTTGRTRVHYWEDKSSLLGGQEFTIGRTSVCD